MLEEACPEQHRGFLSLVERGRPFVTLKLAATLDGRIATSRGESRWITGDAARARVHALRASSDAVAVGSGTARADDPELTARRGRRVVHRPVRVVFDSALSLSPRAASRAARTPSAPGCSPRPVRRPPAAAPSRRRACACSRCAAGAGTSTCAGPSRASGARGSPRSSSKAAEASPRRCSAAGLVDELHWFVAPAWLGADGAAGARGRSASAASRSGSPSRTPG